MESATEAAVHEVAAFGPEWFAVIFGCALIGFLGRWAAQNDRSISAQERTNVVLQSINTSLDTLNTQLMDSKASSKSMGEIVADMNHKVDEIHRELMK